MSFCHFQSEKKLSICLFVLVGIFSFKHRRRKVLNIVCVCVRGGKVQNILGGGQGGPNFSLAVNCLEPPPIQCQMIIFLTLKTDNLAKLRIY